MGCKSCAERARQRALEQQALNSGRPAQRQFQNQFTPRKSVIPAIAPRRPNS